MLLLKIVILQTIVFGLVLFFLRKILTGDTDSAVNRLNESYEEVKKKKEELVKLITDLEAEYNKKKEEAEKIGGEITDKAKTEAESKKVQMLKDAKEESEGIIAKAMGTVDNIRKEVTSQMELKTITFCGELLKNVISHKAAPKINDIMVKDFISDLENADMTKIGPEVDSIEIDSCAPLEKGDTLKISEIVAGKLKRQVKVSERTDPDLLGGLTVKFGSLVLDGSLAGKIRDSMVIEKGKIK
jgi:F0F1-type ATP synthase delta subunit